MVPIENSKSVISREDQQLLDRYRNLKETAMQIEDQLDRATYILHGLETFSEEDLKSVILLLNCTDA